MMKKLIELDAAIDVIEAGRLTKLIDAEIAINGLKALPPIDATPVVHSEWIPKEKTDTPYGLEMECAKCGFSVIVNDALYFKFCPHCGARMDEKGR